MSKRWLLNAGLALLVAALALVMVFKPGTHKTKQIPPLTGLPVAGITHIRLLRPGEPEIDLDKTGAEWMMTAPRKARANQFRVDELLRLAVARSATNFIAPAAELGKYGLDKPRAELWLNDQEISFGGPHPIDPAFYILYKGQVHVVPEHFDNAVTAGLSDFFDTQLLDNKYKPIEFRLPGLRLTKQADGSWQVTPPNKELSTDRVNRFVDQWRYAQALSVEPYSGSRVIDHIRITFAPTEKGTPAAAGTRPADNKHELLNLGILARKPELVLYREDEGLEYHFPAEMANQLLKLKPD